MGTVSERREARRGGRRRREDDYDVVIVGYGPVGQAAAALLGQAGHRVAVFERFRALYKLPRAVHFDDEIMRVWQAIGIVDRISAGLQPMSTYDWFGADGEPILQMRQPSPARCGWSPSYSLYQPDLERALDRAVAALPNVEVHRGWSAERLVHDGDRAQLTLRGVEEDECGTLHPRRQTRSASGRYVIGADGANSFVREMLAIAFEDLGFAERWLVVDVRPLDMQALAHLPVAAQWCDPVRPHMHVQNGRRHRRFEFMLLPGEGPADFDEARVWGLLEPEFGPSDGSIVRSTVYEFRGCLAHRMRSGRVLLAGDAAKTTPPFMGQGMCGGIRDVLGAAWRLDLLLRGRGHEGLLDDYCVERRGQNESIIRLSTEMGRVSCVLDREAAEERDRALRAAPAAPAPPVRRIEGGMIAAGRPLAGTLSVQGTLAGADGEGRLDDVAGRGFQLLTRRAVALAPPDAELVRELDARLVALDSVRDLDGRLTNWFDEHELAAVLVRPDFYVFGAVQAHEEIPGLLAELCGRLHAQPERSIEHAR